ncbi:2OG-Fe(II) oxygenase superfamily protein [Diplocarpon mali]|nr:2OG-Fe(II) oxygenase superfamily protein [Diplocarpon mali]
MSAPPILDFARFYSSDPEQKAALVDEVINCCLHNGFFQITGHLVPLQLQSRVLQCSKRFFKQPLDEKRKVSKALTLNLSENYFDEFTSGAVATMRLLHYPPQPADSDEKLSRGIGAHTDFGAITLLLQEEVDGLQVWDKETQTWLDVIPTKGAYVEI